MGSTDINGVGVTQKTQNQGELNLNIDDGYLCLLLSLDLNDHFLPLSVQFNMNTLCMNL